jgi:hypothetical protein
VRNPSLSLILILSARFSASDHPHQHRLVTGKWHLARHAPA